MKDSKKPFLKEHYLEQVAKELTQKFGYKNCHQVPSIEKVVINSGIGSDADKGQVADIKADVAKIAGQEPVTTRAKNSISNFKLREGMPNGVKATLRGDVMYEFLYRLLAVALPATRDFRGVSRKMDGRGNYTLGIPDHTIFPEINVEGNRNNIGLDITIVTSAATNDEGFELLSLMGMPFRKQSTDAQQAA